MRSFIICTLHRDKIKENEMGEKFRTHSEDEKCIHNLVGNPEWKRSLGRLKRRWEVNIKVTVKETG
jgi:hypothetical protein